MIVAYTQAQIQVADQREVILSVHSLRAARNMVDEKKWIVWSEVLRQLADAGLIGRVFIGNGKA